MDKAIEYAVSGLKCDTKGCEFRDDTVRLDDYEKWLNARCPTCGGNLLTVADLMFTRTLCATADLINSAGIVTTGNELRVKVLIHMDGSGKVTSEVLEATDSKA